MPEPAFYGILYVFLANSLLYGKIEPGTQTHPTVTLQRIRTEG